MLKLFVLGEFTKCSFLSRESSVVDFSSCIHQVVAALEGSMDSFMSGMLVLLVLVGTVLMSVFLVFQVS